MVNVEFLYGITENQIIGWAQLLHSPVWVLALPEHQAQLGPLLPALFL